MIAKKHQALLIGWQEWISLPELKIPALKVKIDTGAKTSSLHAFEITRFRRGTVSYVRFLVHPLQGDSKTVTPCTARVIDVRSVMSSNGHREKRPVIQTSICLGEQSWEIELTLSNRDPLRHRMILGREALHRRVIIDPAARLLQGKISKKELAKLYKLKP